MNIHYTETFHFTSKRLIKKSDLTQKAIDKAISLFTNNPLHPSLEFKHIICKMNKNLYSIRINKNYRILGTKTDDENIRLEQVLNHKEYDRAVKGQNC